MGDIMEDNLINSMFNRFNNLIDSLIEDFNQYNFDEETVVFLAEKTKNFIGFSKFALFNVIFGALKTLNNLKDDFHVDVTSIENILNKLFENINESLDNILPEDEEEEPLGCHCHGHNHEHHHHVDVENIQDDIEKIKANLVMIKKLIDDIAVIVISSLKYQANEINDEIFKKEIDNFKSNFNDFKKDFEGA